MDLAKQSAGEPLLTTAELAAREDFTLGGVIVSPSTRGLRGPKGAEDLEPRVMQVLVVLADAAGQVVTRDTLFNRCWGGVFVGEDSLNRAVAAVRRAAEAVGGRFEVDTIPRTGYRLKVPKGEGGHDDDPDAASVDGVSRRGLVAGGAAAATVIAGAAWWGSRRWRETSRFDALMAEGDEAFRNGSAFEGGVMRLKHNLPMMEIYDQAVRLRPDSARAWGLLAYFRSASADEAPAKTAERMTAEAQDAVRRALALDPDEPNARVGLYLLEGRMLDWTARDRQLRGILKTDPGNLLAMTELMTLLQASGYTRESWTLNERILQASPFARAYLVVRAMKLWILGRIRESDNVIDRVRGLWPEFSFGFIVRLMLFALTDRPRAAMAMLPSAPAMLGGPDELSMWRTALTALDTKAPADIESARLAGIEVARKAPPSVNDVVMLLCALGLKDTAFDVTEGFLLWRGKIVSTGQADGKAVDDYSRRWTQWLFTPPVALMRADPRFTTLADAFGLSAYWRARGVRPDYQIYG